MTDNFAIIAAGGAGTRFGGDVPKQYLELNGMPIWTYCARAFERCADVRGVVIAAHPAYHDLIRAGADICGLTKLEKICAAGADRRASVYHALQYVADAHGPDGVVLVHDAARPFLSAGVIRRNIEAARAYGACNTVLPASDTILTSRDGLFQGDVPPRRTLYLMQTPQSFRTGLLLEAHEAVPMDAPDVTDDCTLVAALGFAVRLVAGDPMLFKITRPADLVFAEAAERALRETDGEGRL